MADAAWDQTASLASCAPSPSRVSVCLSVCVCVCVCVCVADHEQSSMCLYACKMQENRQEREVGPDCYLRNGFSRGLRLLT